RGSARTAHPRPTSTPCSSPRSAQRSRQPRPRRGNPMGLRDLTRRLTGFSTPLGGFSWEVAQSSKPLAEGTLDFLADRRVLYSPYEWEIPEHCVQSVLRIREELGRVARDPACAPALKESLDAMRAACRKFL